MFKCYRDRKKADQEERDRQRKCLSIHWMTAQMNRIVRTEDQNQRSRVSSGNRVSVSRTWAILPSFPKYISSSWVRSGEVVIPIKDASATSRGTVQQQQHWFQASDFLVKAYNFRKLGLWYIAHKATTSIDSYISNPTLLMALEKQ